MAVRRKNYTPFGISVTKHGDKEFLKELSRLGCLPAFYLLEEEAKKGPGKDILDLNRIRYNLKRKFGESYTSKDLIEKKKEIRTLFVINQEIYNLPIRSLIYPSNNKALNTKLAKIPFSKTLIDLEKNLRRDKDFKFHSENFTLHNNKSLCKSLIRLNWFFSYNKVYSSRPDGNKCFSEKFLHDLRKTNSKDEILNLINSKSKSKRKLKRFLDLLPLDNLLEDVLIQFLSCLTDRISELKIILSNNQKVALMRAYEIYNGIKSDIKNKKSVEKLPIYYLYSFEKSKQNMDALDKSFNKGFTRIKHLFFLNPLFKEVFESDDLDELLESLERSYGSYG